MKSAMKGTVCCFAVNLLLFLTLLCGAEAIARTYTTTFSATENPISEGGNWINGKTDGKDWHDVRTTGSNAIGTQVSPFGYDDSTALVTGTWGADQTVEATVYIGTRPINFAEVEIRLRNSINATTNSGYEILFSVMGGTTYHQIVRWNGALGSFNYLDISPGACGNISALSNGDRIKATIIGRTITTYIDRGSGFVQQCTATDSTFSSGNPGIGFYTQGTSDQSQFGLTDFMATDGKLAPSAPVNLRVVH